MIFNYNDPLKMKTSISNIIRVPLILAFLFVWASSFGQKSVNYNSVGSQLEEITNFIDDSCKKADKISSEVINDLELFVKKNTNRETIAKITDWSETQLKDLNGAVQETKIWLSKQQFAPIKHSKAPNKDLSGKK